MKTKIRYFALFLLIPSLAMAEIQLNKSAIRTERSTNFLLLTLPFESSAVGPVMDDMIVTLLDSQYEPLAKTEKKVVLLGGKQDETVALPITEHTPATDQCRIRIDFLGNTWLKSFTPEIQGQEIHIIGQKRWIAGSRSAIRVIVTRSDNGQPLANASVQATIFTEKPSQSVATDDNGTAFLDFDIPNEIRGTQDLKIEVTSPLGENTVYSPIEIVPGTKIFLSTDKPVYQPNQLIHIRALAAHKTTGVPLADRPIVLEVFDGKGNKVFKQQETTSEFGIVSADFQLADEVNQGDYKIQALLDDEVSEKTVQVYEYVLPKFRVDIKNQEKFYAPGDEVSGTVNSRYFFGKPVAGAKVTVVANCFDVGFNEFATAEAITDDEGKAEYKFQIPDRLVGQPQFKGNSIIQMDVRVRDTADHEEQKMHTFHVAVDPLQIEAIPESGRLIPGVENEIYLVASTPDGSVAQPELTVRSKFLDQPITVQCDENGIASIRLTPQISRATDTVVVPFVQNISRPSTTMPVLNISTESNGKKINITKDLKLETAEANLLLRVNKGVYTVGQSMDISALSAAAPNETVFLDIIKNDQTVLTKTLRLKDGRGSLSLPLDNQLTGSLVLNAYIIGSGGTMIRDTRQVVVLRSDDLRIEITPDQEEYQPGQPAQLKIAVTNQQGQPVRAALGMNIVDESVYSLSEKEPGLAKVFFAIERELLQPKVEIHGYQLDKVVRLSAEDYQKNDELSKALLAKLDTVSEYGINIDTAQEKDRQAHNEIQQIRNIMCGKMLPALSKPMEVVEALLFLEEKPDILPTIDPWGRPYQLIQDKDTHDPNRDNIYLVCNGRDGKSGTSDDIRMQTYSNPTRFNWTFADSSKFIGANAIDSFKFHSVHSASAPNRSKTSQAPFVDPIPAQYSYFSEQYPLTRERIYAVNRRAGSRGMLAPGEAVATGIVPADPGMGGYGMGMGGMGMRADAGPEGENNLVLNDMGVGGLAFMTDDSASIQSDSVPPLVDREMNQENGYVLDVFGGQYPTDLSLKESLQALGYTGAPTEPNSAPLVVNGQVDTKQLSQLMDSLTEDQKLFEEENEKIALLAQKIKDLADQQKAEIDQHQKSVRVRRYFPETLFYTPETITDDNGLLAINLPMADSITTWRMSAMANAKNGSLGDATAAMKVFKPFFVDLDLPVALIQNDEVTIPVAVYNYLPQPQEVKVSLERAPWFNLLEGEFDRTISIAANEVTSVTYRIQAQQLGQQPITVYAWGSSDNDAIGRSIEVRPNGSPQFITHNGRLTASLQQEVNFPADRVEGADKLFVKIYPGFFSQVVEGLDAILQMPYGCFEQTSSTTYPNILALQYMQQTGKITPAIEMKAREYINLGYQRLLTFEIDGGGFQVFGSPPATRILSAYGLLEFTDMSQVHPVDANIIERTITWLLSQMNEDGTWDPDQNYAHAEMWKSIQDNKILSTAYIAMALAQSGVYEQQLAVTTRYLTDNADQAQDAYTLSILCNALLAIDKESSTTKRCVQKLVDLSVIEGDRIHWSSEASMSFARGNHASVETTAWAVLALLEDGRFPQETGKALNWIIDQKDSRGTWGTTHGTVLALKALITSLGKQTQHCDATILVHVNGNEAARLEIKPETSDLFRQLDLSQFASDQNDVEIDLEGEGSLLYQIVGKYFVPWKGAEQKPNPADLQIFGIQVQYDRSQLQRNDTVTCQIDSTNNKSYRVEMVMIDIGIPPGFRVERPTLDEYVEKGTIAKYSLTPRQMLIYLESMDGNQTIQLKVPMKATLPMMAKAPESTIYEYYNPEQKKASPPQELEVK